MMRGVFFLLINILSIQSGQSQEISRAASNDFLKSQTSLRSKYEESKETVETKREFCLNEYQQQERVFPRRQAVSSLCSQYCNDTNDCQTNKEQSACFHPSWSARMIKYVTKIDRMCYVRITKVVRYDQAEQLCRDYNLQPAIIDNLRLLEKLRQLNMFNTTCKGQCPTAKGYYVGLKRVVEEEKSSESAWIWSNNDTWIENQTDCGDYSGTAYANASLLCYLGKDGKKKVTVWNIGEPNNYHSLSAQSGEECVEIIADSDKNSSPDQVGKFNDIPCNKPTLGVICQMKDTKPLNLTKFEYFAAVAGFNETESAEDDLLNSLFANFNGPIAANLDAMAQMAAALEGLLVLPSFSTGQATSVLNVVDQLVDVTSQVEVEESSLKTVTNKLLRFLDRFPAKIRNDEQQKMSFEYENMNMSVVNVNRNRSDKDWFTIPSNSETDDRSTIIEVNLRVLQETLNSSEGYRIIETIFSNFNLFPQTNRTSLGIPISYQIANYSSLLAQDDLVRFQIRVPQAVQSQNISCAYWSFKENNGSWMVDDSCRFMGYSNDYAECYCSHLTHFALLMVPESERLIEPLTKAEELILTLVTYIGIGLSILGLVLTLLTYALFRQKSKNHLHKSLMMLCASIFTVNCLYIPFSLTKPNEFSSQSNILCSILGFLFHYFFLTSFMWMLIMAFVQYLHFVRIFNSYISHFFLKTCAIGWIVPLIFPSIVLFFDFKRSYLGQGRCWIENGYLLYFTFVLPILLVVLCNLLLFGFILRSIFQHNAAIVAYQKNHSKLQLSAALCCFVSIGCTWLFGIVVLVRPIFIHQLIFCICNSSQGFLIFLFHVYLSKAKRDLWRTFLIERDLGQGPHIFSRRTDTLTISQSSGGNISSMTRPVKFRFSATSSSTDQQRSLAPIRAVLLDQKESGFWNKDRTLKSPIQIQTDLLIEQAQRHAQVNMRTRMANASYA